MNSGTSTTLIPATEIIDKMVNAAGQAEKETYRIIWDFLMSFLADNWLKVILFLFALLLVSFIRALFGRWGMFGSVLYHYLYFGILFILGLIFGPSIFANVFIDLLLFMLYLVCFALVGKILSGLGFRRR